jgi:uncharacterized membrane protein
MRTALTIVFLIMSIGGGFAIFDADDSTERRFDALAALIGAVGLFVMAQSLRRKIGDEAYARVMGFTPGFVASVVKFIVLTVALPVFVFWIATGHLRMRGEGEELLAVALGVAGLGAWGWLQR